MPEEISTEDVVLMDDIIGHNFVRYATAVNLHRSIPDGRDGLKPVQRRILFSMHQLGVYPSGRFVKTARVVGDTMGRLHPHGDASIGDAVNKLAQWWNLRYPLIDGDGNFGSPNVDIDPPAAPRYTEVRLSRFGELMLGDDLDPEIIEYSLTYDDSSEEPTVLPSAFPNVICNGQSGIGVAMSSDMFPHNLTEVCKVIKMIAKDPKTSVKRLLKTMPGPDFPTGGFVLGTEGIEKYYETGKGTITLQGKADVIPNGPGEMSIVVTELPYGVQPNRFIKDVVSLCEEKKLEGVTNINDARGKGTEPIRMVIELKRRSDSTKILKELYESTCLRVNMSVNQTVIVNGVPALLSMPQLIDRYVEHRISVIVGRYEVELAKNEARTHLLAGLIQALDRVDEVIQIIRGADDGRAARDALKDELDIDDDQANYILDLALRRLARLAVEEIKKEFAALRARAREIRKVLKSRGLQVDILCDEINAMLRELGDDRMTTIRAETAEEITTSELMEDEDVVAFVSRDGYCKRVSLSEFTGKKGEGSIKLNKAEGKRLGFAFVAKANDDIIMFTEDGDYHRICIGDMPKASRTGKGLRLDAVITPGRVVGVVVDSGGGGFVVTCTKMGLVKRTEMSEYRTKSDDGQALRLGDGDSLGWVVGTDGKRDLVFAKSGGFLVRFPEGEVRPQGRIALGVAGVKIDESEELIDFFAIIPRSNSEVVSVGETGMAKRTNLREYRATKRNTKGVKTMSLSEKTGSLAGFAVVTEDEEVIVATKSGKTNRVKAGDIKEQGRATQGVRTFEFEWGDPIVRVFPVRFL